MSGCHDCGVRDGYQHSPDCVRMQQAAQAVNRAVNYMESVPMDTAPPAPNRIDRVQAELNEHLSMHEERLAKLEQRVEELEAQLA